MNGRSGKQGAGSREQEAGSRKLEAGSGKIEKKEVGEFLPESQERKYRWKNDFGPARRSY